MIKNIMFSLLITLGFGVFAQEMKEGSITFSSEKKGVESTVNEFKGFLDLKNKKIQFIVPVTNFYFKSNSQKEHFNSDKGMNTTEFVEAKFDGVLICTTDLLKDGEHKIIAKGKITIYGVELDFSTKGMITIENGVIQTTSEFKINRESFGITTKYASMLDDDILVKVNATF